MIDSSVSIVRSHKANNAGISKWSLTSIRIIWLEMQLNFGPASRKRRLRRNEKKEKKLAPHLRDWNTGYRILPGTPCHYYQKHKLAHTVTNSLSESLSFGPFLKPASFSTVREYSGLGVEALNFMKGNRAYRLSLPHS